MRAFVTGGTGFIGGRVVRRLRDRGDEVVALVRSPSRASDLAELGCELVEGDLTFPDAIRRGVQAGGVYGPGDHSELGNIIDQTRTGKLRMLMFPETGFNLVHVDDVAEGILLAHDAGKVGESYVLGGEISTMGDLIRKVADLSG